jgi:hypothetical protein
MRSVSFVPRWHLIRIKRKFSEREEKKCHEGTEQIQLGFRAFRIPWLLIRRKRIATKYTNEHGEINNALCTMRHIQCSMRKFAAKGKTDVISKSDQANYFAGTS